MPSSRSIEPAVVDRGDFSEHALRRGGAHRRDQIGFDRVKRGFVGHPDTFNSIGFVHVKNRHPIPIDSSCHVSFILEHIMNN
jgi:hypothetical protein